jgi:hypothetical protein
MLLDEPCEFCPQREFVLHGGSVAGGMAFAAQKRSQTPIQVARRRGSGFSRPSENYSGSSLARARQ